MAQMMFFFTIYPQLKVSSKVSDILLFHVSGMENELEFALNKIATKEEMDKMNKNHKNALKNQREEFKS